MFSRGPRLRALRPTGVQGAIDHALTDPLVNALPGARLVDLRHSLSIGQEFSMAADDRRPDGLLWHGVNVAPVSAGPRAIGLFAEHLAARPRRCSSIVGERSAVASLWTQLEGVWGAQARELRWSQPLLEATQEPSSPLPPSGVRAAVRGEEGIVFPAAVAMFREEVGVDPLAHDGGRGYRGRVRDLVALGRTYVVVSEGRVLFKADVGAVLGPVAQIHGVWVDPHRRGEGIARAAMRDLVPLVARDHAPRVSLYVNDFNEPARRAYAAAGFTPRGELSTILF
jgi:predicted GNAT family acetyltransferase